MPCRRHKEKVLKTTTLTARENLLKGARLAIPGMVCIIYGIDSSVVRNILAR